MGQQQLLLIVLGIIVIGIAVGIANQLFDANAEEDNKNSVASEIVNLGILAQQYYSRPIEMGGGSFNFSGWKVPAELDTTTNGIYSIKLSNDEEIVLMGTPQPGKGYTWHVQSLITKHEIVTEIKQ